MAPEVVGGFVFLLVFFGIAIAIIIWGFCTEDERDASQQQETKGVPDEVPGNPPSSAPAAGPPAVPTGAAAAFDARPPVQPRVQGQPPAKETVAARAPAWFLPANPDDELLIPLPPAYRRTASPEMIVPRHDFGPKVGVYDAIRLHDLWLLEGITDEKMAEIDAARKAKGLKPMFADEE